MHDKARRLLDQLNAAPSLDFLRVPPSNRLEKLRGNLNGYWSLRINDQWRIIFRWEGKDALDVQIVDYLEVMTMLPKKRPPTHPGQMLLKEFLEPLGVTQNQFAAHLGWTYARLNEIVNGRRRITAESALALGDALQTGPEFWLNLQRDWDLWHSLQHHEKIRPLKRAG